jgi:hypothetical protein
VKQIRHPAWILIFILAIIVVFTGYANKPGTPPADNNTSQPPVSPKPAANKEKATLYFSDDQAMYLTPEIREISYQGNNLPLAIVEELVRGPAVKEHSPTLPKTTRVLSLEVQNGTAYVNLSKDFERDYPGGTTGEAMALGSIVKSLTELKNIYAIQFLIEGKKVEVLAKGHAEISRPLERSIALGTLEQSKENLEKAQKKADAGQLEWRLDPLETARKEGPLHGLYVNGEYKLISKEEKGTYSGTGEALVRHTYKGSTYDIKLIQPVKSGKGGIWAINSIMPFGTQEEAITGFLENRFLQPNFGGKVFSAYEILGKKNYDARIVLYIWAYCQEYVKESGKLQEKTGVSLPLALTLYAQDENHNQVIDYRQPEDGKGYTPSIKRIFPSDIQDKITARQGKVSELEQKARLKAENYFK